MKKKIILGFAVLAIAAVAAFNVNLNTNQKSDMSLLALANVEALADGEINPSNCPGGYCNWSDSWGNKCSACCPTGKDPICNSYGCECRS